jgi:hypothetical protein
VRIKFAAQFQKARGNVGVEHSGVHTGPRQVDQLVETSCRNRRRAPHEGDLLLALDVANQADHIRGVVERADNSFITCAELCD